MNRKWIDIVGEVSCGNRWNLRQDAGSNKGRNLLCPEIPWGNFSNAGKSTKSSKCVSTTWSLHLCLSTPLEQGYRHKEAPLVGTHSGSDEDARHPYSDLRACVHAYIRTYIPYCTVPHHNRPDHHTIPHCPLPNHCMHCIHRHRHTQTLTHLLRNILSNYWCGMHRTCKNTSVKPDRK